MNIKFLTFFEQSLIFMTFYWWMLYKRGKEIHQMQKMKKYLDLLKYCSTLFT